MNNLMKIDIDWKPQSTPTLINTMGSMVELQFLDLKRALYNKGNYRLHVFSGKFAIREDIYRKKTEGAELKYFTNFLKFDTSKAKYIVSSDGTYQIPNKMKNIAKKLRQSKRPVNSRTSIYFFFIFIFFYKLLLCYSQLCLSVNVLFIPFNSCSNKYDIIFIHIFIVTFPRNNTFTSRHCVIYTSWIFSRTTQHNDVEI